MGTILMWGGRAIPLHPTSLIASLLLPLIMGATVLGAVMLMTRAEVRAISRGK